MIPVSPRVSWLRWLCHRIALRGSGSWRVGLGIPLGSGLPPLRTAGPAVLPGAAPERVRVCALLQARRVRRTPSAVLCTPCTVHRTRHTLHRTRYTAYPALYTSETLHPPLYHCTPCSLEAPNRTVATRNKPSLGFRSRKAAPEAAERVCCVRSTDSQVDDGLDGDVLRLDRGGPSRSWLRLHAEPLIPNFSPLIRNISTRDLYY